MHQKEDKFKYFILFYARLLATVAMDICKNQNINLNKDKDEPSTIFSAKISAL
ncbi:hypothetical protein [Campylobacter sp. 19-13652]|uniref:hypothetical protein n=1 Tax=Campylobacter sp. 19-13652 TaxID=2840180 RepID=UPI001C853EC4|nr:hypothetical protein [Campylobacter sp. 19-13652]